VANLFFRPTFTGFGPSALDPAAGLPPLHYVRARQPDGLRARVGQHCPRRPGVYGMVNLNGELIYVGKAKCLRSRLLSYFRPDSRDPKAGRILGQTRTLVWEYAPSEFAALLRELELIHRWQPRCNVQGQPARRRRCYVCLGRRPAAYAFVSRRPAAGAAACFGPVPAGRKVREAVRRLNDLFGLRDCPQKQQMVFADQQELFPEPRAAGCIRFEIGTCLGPCAAACTRSAYADRVQAARAFLEGTDMAALAGLEQEMAEAAAALAFEKAAGLRDRVEVLRWLGEQLDRLRRAREQHTFVYPVQGHADRELWYLIHQGRVLAALPAPCDGATGRVVAAAVEAVYQGRRTTLWHAAGEVDAVLLVAGWFRKHRAERARALTPEQALARCAAASQ
jgi:excinuclease ABC subunit C